jgi:hypothetical protein
MPSTTDILGRRAILQPSASSISTRVLPVPSSWTAAWCGSQSMRSVQPRSLSQSTVRFGPPLNGSQGTSLPPLNTSQASFILETANQCDVVPAVPDFTCFRGTADVLTANANHAGGIQLDLIPPNKFSGSVGVMLPAGKVVHRFEDMCDDRTLTGLTSHGLDANWRGIAGTSLAKLRKGK